MKDDDNKGHSGGEQRLDFDSDSSTDNSVREPRREPVFSGFDQEDEYEEPDRDTDYASSYLDDDVDDFLEEADDEFTRYDDEQEPGQEVIREAELPAAPWHGSSLAEDGQEDDFPEPDSEQGEEIPDTDPDWENEEYLEDYQQEGASWPLGLIAVAVLAVILLAAGGYGVIQQRAATEEEIRQLRAQLATAVNPAKTNVSNDALREAKQRNVELSMAMESLKLENRRLTDTVAGLETQLEAQQQALAKPAPPPPEPDPPAPKPTPAKPKPAPVAAAAPPDATSGSWFVNFGSYSQRGMADSWSAKLKPASGRSVVTTTSKDGKTFYRVRVVNLADRESAEQVARQLEKQYGLSKLWVGR
jgi:cell division septation protein DedD